MSDTKWAADKVERRDISGLIPYDRNAKLHPDSQIDQLANSIREWGWTIPILIDENNVVLVAGFIPLNSAILKNSNNAR